MALQMQTRQDLLNVINTLKKEELKEAYHPYTMKQLGWFCNPNHIFHRYRDFQIPKKSGGTHARFLHHAHIVTSIYCDMLDLSCNLFMNHLLTQWGSFHNAVLWIMRKYT